MPLFWVVTDPPDPLADLVRGYGFQRVMTTGTFLDSLRFRYHLARRFNVDPTAVDAHVVGDHGTSEVFLWSSARIGGMPVAEVTRQSIEQEVRFANIAIIEGTGASQYGIGMVCARIAQIVLRDERAVIPVGCFNSAYGVTLSLPSASSGAAGSTGSSSPPVGRREAWPAAQCRNLAQRPFDGFDRMQDHRRETAVTSSFPRALKITGDS